ncbi:MAG: hypothetical protein ACFCU8_19485 [Thermosynechococcaceae cyanobacterium]
MAHTLTPPTEGQKKHQVNIVQTLAHRTNVASVQQDLQLLKLLQQERQQLNDPTEQKPNGFFQRLKVLIAKHTEISIEKIQAPSGQTAWRVYNPRTRQSRYTETVAEVVAWLEAQH